MWRKKRQSGKQKCPRKKELAPEKMSVLFFSLVARSFFFLRMLISVEHTKPFNTTLGEGATCMHSHTHATITFKNHVTTWHLHPWNHLIKMDFKRSSSDIKIVLFKLSYLDRGPPKITTWPAGSSPNQPMPASLDSFDRGDSSVFSEHRHLNCRASSIAS